MTDTPLGCKLKKTVKSYYMKRKERREAAERNQIEVKFGQGKNGYTLTQIIQIILNVNELDGSYHICNKFNSVYQKFAWQYIEAAYSQCNENERNDNTNICVSPKKFGMVLNYSVSPKFMLEIKLIQK